MSPRLLLCGMGARGKCALALGPMVMALEDQLFARGVPREQIKRDSFLGYQ